MATRYWIGGSGSQSWATTTNWSAGTVPVTGDDVVIRNSTSLIDSGLAQSAVTLASLVVESSFTGAVGSATTPLSISATVARIDGGVTRFFANFGTNPFSLLVRGTGESIDTNKETVRVVGVNAANVVSVDGGSVGIANDAPTDVATIGMINANGGTVNSGKGVTWTTANVRDGILNIYPSVAGANSINTYGGQTNTLGIGLITNVTMIGGAVNPNHRPAAAAMITTLSMRGSGAEANFTSNPATGTVTNLVLKAGTVRQFSPTQITYTTPSLDFDENGTFTCGVAA